MVADYLGDTIEIPSPKSTDNNLAKVLIFVSLNSPLVETFFEGVKKLLPAHYFELKDGNLKIERYWQAEFSESKKEKVIEEATDEVESVMQDSIKAHMLSDVEVGSFLSSGIDSSYLATSFEGDKTFTVGFDYSS